MVKILARCHQRVAVEEKNSNKGKTFMLITGNTIS